MADLERQAADRLRERYPAWFIWCWPKATGGMTWCAERRGDEHSVLKADSLGELEKLLAELES
jgi:hypothetical protein